MAEHAIIVAAFRAKFPAFSDAGAFPDVTLETFWNLGAEFIGKYDGPLLDGSALQTALDFMGAHLLAQSEAVKAGQPLGIVTQTTIDKVSVTVAPPSFKTEWERFLSTTPYGAQLWAFLSLKSAGGFYVGGAYSRGAFRGPAGRFR